MKDAILKVFSITLAFVFFLSGCSLTGNKKNKSESTEDDKPVSADRSVSESSEENPATGEIFCKMPEPDHIFYNEENDYCYADNQLLLTANDGVTKEQIEALAVQYGGKIVGCIEVADDYQLEFDKAFTEEELEETVKQFLSSGIVLDACANRAFRTESGMVAKDYVPNDYLWKDENWKKRDKYGINWNAKAIRAQEAWAYKNVMVPVNVGIIDSPFFEYSDDLDFVKIWNNPSRKNVNSVFDGPQDNDSQDNDSQNNDPTDKHHGTIIAGVIGASFDNNEGIAGIAPNARLYGAALHKAECEITDENLKTAESNNKFIGANNPEYYESAYTWLVTWKYFLANLITSECKVINVSQTNPNVEYSQKYLAPFLKKFIDRNYEFLIVSIAGNYGDDDSNSSVAGNLGPFNCITLDEVKDRIIVVGTAGYKGSYCKHGKDNDYGYNMTSNSGYGDRVDILAPGVHIYSTLYEDDYNSEYGNCYKGHNGPIHYNTGSSFAAPHVAGVAAMCFGVNPSLTGKQVKEIILSGAKKGDNKIKSYHETDKYYYMVDAKEAVQKAINMNGEQKQYHEDEYVIFGTITENDQDDNKHRMRESAVIAYQMEANGLYREVSSAETLDTDWYELFLPKGTYTLVFTCPGFASEVISDFVVSGEKTRVQQDVTLYLPLENVIINGTVKDKNGQPVADAEITITGGSNAKRGVRLFQTEQGVLEYEIILPDSSPGKDQKTVKTDQSGYYSAEFVQNAYSTYTVMAEKKNYESYNSDDILIEITGTEKDIYYTHNIDLKDGGMYKAYCEVVKKLMNQYGEGEYNDRTGNMTGLSVVRLVDFNGDGQEELLCAYSNNSTLHTQEIFCYENGKTYSIYQDKANCSTGGYAPYVNYVVCKNQSYILTEAIASAPAFTRGKWRRIDNGINEVVLDYDGSWDPKDNFNINGEKTNREGFYALINNFKNSGTDYLILLYSSREESTEYIQVGDRVLEETQKTLEKIGYKSEAWKKAYVDCLDQFSGITQDYLLSRVKYGLVDIDGDDIPELWITLYDEAAGGYLYSYHDGTVAELPVTIYGFSYIPEAGLVKKTFSKQGYCDDTIYSLTDGEFIKIHSGSYWNTGTQPYTWDGKTVSSESEYMRELDKAFDNTRAVSTEKQGKNIKSWNDITQAIMKYDAG